MLPVKLLKLLSRETIIDEMRRFDCGSEFRPEPGLEDMEGYSDRNGEPFTLAGLIAGWKNIFGLRWYADEDEELDPPDDATDEELLEAYKFLWFELCYIQETCVQS